MRLIFILAALLWLARPGIVTGQSFELHGSAGPTLVDRGYSLAGGVGLFPTSHIGIVVDVERTHLVSRERITPDSASRFRGGTLTLASAQLRVAPLGRDRVGPYGMVGFAAGVSRPNVNEAFPNPVTNDVRAVFFGGGLEVPLRTGLSLFADGRMMLGAEAGELLAVAPIRAGVAWRF
jgi:hypothetical protein